VKNATPLFGARSQGGANRIATRGVFILAQDLAVTNIDRNPFAHVWNPSRPFAEALI
jgi:hypothetical protein